MRARNTDFADSQFTICDVECFVSFIIFSILLFYEVSNVNENISQDIPYWQRDDAFVSCICFHQAGPNYLLNDVI